MLVTPPHKVHMWKSNSQHDGIWRWGLWEEIRAEASRMGLAPLLQRHQRAASPLLFYGDTVERQASVNLEAGPHLTVFSSLLILAFLASKMMRKKWLSIISHPAYNTLL